MLSNPTAWLESQSGYWRGRAMVRRPDPSVDVWSEEALVSHRKAAEYELMAEQAETLSKGRHHD